MASNSGGKTTRFTLEAVSNVARPFKEASDAVADLTAKINGQASAAAKGEATTRELGTTLDKLADVQKGLAQSDSFVRSYESLGQQLEAAQAKAADFAERLASVKTAQDGAEKVTRSMTKCFRQASLQRRQPTDSPRLDGRNAPDTRRRSRTS
jgi:hypothetical protein